MAEDAKGNILTINHRDATKPSGVGTVTTSGSTDVFGINEEGALCSKVELEELVEQDEKVRWEYRVDP